MTPSPFGQHGAMLVRLCTAVTNAIDQAGCNATALAEIDWIISDDTVVRPDASVVCGQPPDGHIESAPAIVIEVLSESTRERDTTHKRALYQEQQVAWYLIADPADRTAELLRLNNRNEYVSVPIGKSAEVEMCQDCRLNVDFGWLLR